MKRICIYVAACIAAVLCLQPARAQYYTWGADPASYRWRVIKSDNARVIYPDTAVHIARRTMHYIDAVQPSIGYGFTHPPLRIPFVMHTENFRSNGMVMWLPKRVEFLTSPAVNGYSMPWTKQLVAHEYRHAVQYNNLNRGVIRVLSYIFGQQGSTVGLLFLPLAVIEGDAVMSETQMSTFGRGLQPRFTLEYRALGNIASLRRNHDKWFCGSYRDFVPDHYQLGYQITSYAYTRYGADIWNRVARFAARNPYMIATTKIALEKYYKTDMRRLFEATFDDLEYYWSALPEVEPTTVRIDTPRPTSYTIYSHPQPLSGSLVLALKEDMDFRNRFVTVDTRTGEEHSIVYTGDISTRPALQGRRVWWTEYRQSTLYGEKVNSRICYMDLSDGRTHTVRRIRNALYATPMDAGRMAWVEYRPDGSYYVVLGDDSAREHARTAAPYPAEIHGLAWDDTTDALYTLMTDDDGMWIGKVGGKGIEHVTQGAYITLSNLRAGGGRLYFGSIASGRDEAHCYDLASGCEYQLSESQYGSFSPSAPRADGSIVLTTYDKEGYHLSMQAADALMRRVAPAPTPLNIVNPPRTKWDVVNLDTVRFTAADSLAAAGKRDRRFSKALHIFNIHSWAPVSYDPFYLLDDFPNSINLGATIMSQDILSTASGYATYGWNKRSGHFVKGGLKYYGLGMQLEVNATYGGKQQIYGIMQPSPEERNKWESQRMPEQSKHWAVSAAMSLPMLLSDGYRTRYLVASLGWSFSNGWVTDMDEIEHENGFVTNLDRLRYKFGLHKMAFMVSYSDVAKRARRDFAPRSGVVLTAEYALNPANSDFSSLVSTYVKVYTPGFALHNSLTIEALFQTSLGGYRLPSHYRPLGYKSSRLVPRGYDSSDFSADSYIAASLNYQFPLCYPDGGIQSIVYFKRLRLNFGGDYAAFRTLTGFSQSVAPDGTTTLRAKTEWRNISAFGGDLIADMNFFRMPDSATVSLKISAYYMPQKRRMWFGAGLELPF